MYLTIKALKSTENPKMVFSGEYPKVCVNLQTDVR